MIIKWNQNNMNCIFFKLPKSAKRMHLTLTIKTGSMDDGKKKGRAHFLEHLLILSLNRLNIDYNQYDIIGTTSFDKITYKISCKNSLERIQTAIHILHIIMSGKFIDESYMEIVRSDIIEEYAMFSKKKEQIDLLKMLIEDKNIISSVPIGNLTSIKGISYDDILEYVYNDYRRASISISVVGHVNLNKIKNIIAYEFNNLKRALNPDDIADNISFNLIHTRWLVHNSNGFKIYLRINPIHMYDAPLKERVIEDLALIIIENLIEVYFYRELHIITSVKVTKIRYNRLYIFTCIDITGDTESLNKWYLHNKPKVTSLFYNYIKGEMDKLYFDSFKKEYIKIIKKVTGDLIDNEIVNNFVYGDPIFLKNKYLVTLREVELTSTLEKLFCWFYNDDIKIKN